MREFGKRDWNERGKKQPDVYHSGCEKASGESGENPEGTGTGREKQGIFCADPETLEALRQETPVGRNGTPEDVAQAVLYLADASFVTGQTLGVSGGFLI